jgi:stage V sporulation protein D (sporulation-specific penicillin-binding protein)
VAGTVIRCWKAEGHGMQTFAQAIQNSCNPAFIEIGMSVGKENFFKYVSGFGLTEKTGIDVTGEALGIFFDKNLYGPVENATTSFGQGFQITPIQLITAISAVANNGKYVYPQIVQGLYDSETKKLITEYYTLSEKKILDNINAQSIKNMLQTVVKDGAMGRAAPNELSAGGKTGTAQTGKFDENGKEILTAWFCGFYPFDNPEYTICITMYNGGESTYTAAPVFKKICDCLYYLL